MTETGNMIVDTTSRIFRDLGDPQAVNSAAGDGWKGPLWRALEEAGLTRAWVPEELNGAGAGVADGFEVLRVAGSFAVSLPLAETLLAGWLLSRAGLAVPAGTLSVAPVREQDRIELGPDGTLSGRARSVPFARDAEHIALLAWQGETPVVALVERSRCDIEHHAGLAGEPSDDVKLSGVKPFACAAAPKGIAQDELLLMGAAVRATQMSGALQGMLNVAVAYANERVAFGKPIGKFQVIQHSLARLAGEAAAALVAAGSAADAIDSALSFNLQAFDQTVFLEVASAKIRVGEAAGKGAAIAHQVHGAIGYSAEYVLHRYSRRLLAWRDDFGSESAWALRLGRMVAANGADALWPMLAAR